MGLATFKESLTNEDEKRGGSYLTPGASYARPFGGYPKVFLEPFGRFVFLEPFGRFGFWSHLVDFFGAIWSMCYFVPFGTKYPRFLQNTRKITFE